jgi:hypothetical protein
VRPWLDEEGGIMTPSLDGKHMAAIFRTGCQ